MFNGIYKDKALTMAPDKITYYNYLDTKGWDKLRELTLSEGIQEAC